MLHDIQQEKHMNNVSMRERKVKELSLQLAEHMAMNEDICVDLKEGDWLIEEASAHEGPKYQK